MVSDRSSVYLFIVVVLIKYMLSFLLYIVLLIMLFSFPNMLQCVSNISYTCSFEVFLIKYWVKKIKKYFGS